MAELRLAGCLPGCTSCPAGRTGVEATEEGGVSEITDLSVNRSSSDRS